MPITIYNPKRRPIPRVCLSSACEHTLTIYGNPQYEVSIVITNDTQLHELNLLYRGVDRPTDVLSFSLMEPKIDGLPSSTQEILGAQIGEVYISYQASQRQALTAGHDVTDELVFLAVHGVLHLLGYNDDTEEELAEMIRLGTSVINETKKKEIILR